MKKYITLLFLGILAISCTQDEYMPEPYGEKVPYEQKPKKELDAALIDAKKSLFKFAIDNSSAADLLKTEWKGQPLTFLAPSDEAFIKAGYTEEKLKEMTKEELDSLVFYHTVSLRLDTTVNLSLVGNIKARTKLTNRLFRVKALSSYKTFYYYHFVSIKNNEVIVNGKPVAPYQIIYTTGGDIIPINTFLKRPEKTIWETIGNDSRLSMFMRVLEVTDSIYKKKQSWNDAIKVRLDYKRTASSYSANFQFTSVIAPCNEAFIKAGYNSAEEFLRLNDAHINKINSYAYYSNGYPYDYVTFLKTDSIISYHSSWGEKYYPSDGGTENPSIFYSNELNNDVLRNYILANENERLGKNRTPAIYNPFIFTNENGTIKIRLKNAKEGTEAATVIDADIEALNGPIHIVDRLFIPEDF